MSPRFMISPQGRGPVGPVMRGMQSQEKAKNSRSTFKKLVGIIKPYGAGFSISFLFAFVGVFTSTMAPRILGNITTLAAHGVKTGMFDWNAIKRTVMILVAFHVTAPLFRFIQHFMLTGMSQKIIRDLRSSVNAKLDRLPLSYFDGRTQGEVMSRITNDVDTISQSLQEGISQALISLFTVTSITVMMFITNFVLALAALVTVPVCLFIISTVVKHSQKYFSNNQKYLGEMNGHVEQMYGGHSVVKAFGYSDKAVDEFEKINDKLCEAGWKSNFYSSVMHPLTGFAGNLGYIFVIIVGAFQVKSGNMGIGGIQAFVQYIKRFNQPIQEVANISNVFQSTLAAAERVFEILDEPEEVDDGDLSCKTVQGHVEFRNVNFSYSSDKPLIRNFNLDVEAGKKIAIVGPTGAGKTTIVNLLMRFYDVDKGSILVDGIDVRDLPRDVLRDYFGMVLQDTWLFKGTIAQNIAYGDGSGKVDIKRVRECARLACADHFIETLPGGYDFVLNEEANNISQGEKQLVTIARAFMSNPQMLILDEATSNVDTRTEHFVQQAMENLMKGKTSFIIAHRLSTIRNADMILVLDNGNVVEQGKHDDLLARGGFYSRLYRSQFTSVLSEN
ncbi:MAG: ABC transporter ATP-binding protein/permease [Sphaerochaetaceae bacterium]|nr:ABC transporter ATP-binding protein/permease [Sphaerochaetaceae bacterium]